MQIQSVTLTASRTVQPRPYESARAEVTLTAAFDEFDSQDDVQDALQDLLDQLIETLTAALTETANTNPDDGDPDAPLGVVPNGRSQ